MITSSESIYILVLRSTIRLKRSKLKENLVIKVKIDQNFGFRGENLVTNIKMSQNFDYKVRIYQYFGFKVENLSKNHVKKVEISV